MKNRLKILGYQILYWCFDKYRFSIVIGAIDAAIIAWQYSKSGKINLDCVLSFAVGVVIIFAALLLVKHYGILLTYPKEKNLTAVTMRGVSPTKLKSLKSTEITQLFSNDFKKLLSKKNIHTDIVVNTHSMYSNGVLKILYEMFDPVATVPKITDKTINDIFICNNERIQVRLTGLHTNYMAAIKISRSASQAQIDRFVRRKCRFYEIIIPKKLIE